MNNEFTTFHTMRWLENQEWEWIEWFNQGIELVKLDELYKQSIVYASALENYHTKYTYDFNYYK